MRIFSISNLTLIAVSILLSGCIVQSRQLNNFIEMITTPSIDLYKNSWSLRFSDYESVVFAVSTEKGILFSNEAGDQVLFDGWLIRKIKGMGARQVNMDISDRDNVRTFIRNRRISTHSCDQWEKQKNLGVVRYSQACSDRKSYKNSILVQSNGDISVIRQIVDERYTALTLTKLK